MDGKAEVAEEVDGVEVKAVGEVAGLAVGRAVLEEGRRLGEEPLLPGEQLVGLGKGVEPVEDKVQGDGVVAAEGGEGGEEGAVRRVVEEGVDEVEAVDDDVRPGKPQEVVR